MTYSNRHIDLNISHNFIIGVGCSFLRVRYFIYNIYYNIFTEGLGTDDMSSFV